MAGIKNTSIYTVISSCLIMVLTASCNHCTTCSYDYYNRTSNGKYKYLGNYQYPEQCGTKKEIEQFKEKVDTTKIDTLHYRNLKCVDK